MPTAARTVRQGIFRPVAGAERKQGSIRDRSAPRGRVRAIAIASSTGGPDALAAYLQHIVRGGITAPIMIAQHIPGKYGALLAERLTESLGRKCFEARDGEPLRNEWIGLAPGNRHMRVIRGTPPRIQLIHRPDGQYCHTSADTLFISAAELFGSGLLGVVLTGMGSDGCEGARHIVAAGGRVFAQDENSSAVWGMPGAVVAAGLAGHVGNPLQLARHTLRIANGEQGS